MQVPKAAMFNEDALAKDLEKNLDLDSLPWNLPHKPGLGTRNIINIKGTEKHIGEIEFTVGDVLYVISFVSVADFKGDGTQQVQIILHRAWSLPDKKAKGDDADFLLVRTSPGEPIKVEPYLLRPMAYERPSSALKSKASLMSD